MYTIGVTLDHASLVGATKSIASGDDVRVVYWNGSSNAEIDRIGAGWNTVSTLVEFRLQAAVPASGDSGDAYWLYYGNPAAGSPPADGRNVYLFFDDFEDGAIDWASRWQSTDQSKYSEAGGRITMQSNFSDSSRTIRTQTAFSGAFQWEYTFQSPAGSDDTAYATLGPSNDYSTVVMAFEVYVGSGELVLYYLRTNDTGTELHTGIINNGSLYTVLINKTGPNSFFLQILDDGSLIYTSGTITDWKGDSASSLYANHFAWRGPIPYVYLNDCRFRRLVTPEPSVTLGAEAVDCGPASAPSIGDGPNDASGCSVVLSVSASGLGPLAYQWRKDGVGVTDGGSISGAMTASLTIDPVRFDDAGAYDVVVSNWCDTAISGTATVSAASATDCDADGLPDDCQPNSGEYVWTGGDGASWGANANWDRGDTPGTLGHAVLRNTSGDDNRCVYDVGGVQVCSLLLETTGTGRQALNMALGSTLQVSQETTIGTGSDLVMRGGEFSGGTLTNWSNTISGYGLLNTTIVNNGLLKSTVDVDNILRLTGPSVTNTEDGRIMASAGSLLLLRPASVSQSGELEVRSLAGVLCDQPLSNESGGVVRLLGGTLSGPSVVNQPGGEITGTGTLDCDVDNQGFMTVIADLLIAGNLENDGTIAIQNGVLTVTGSVSGSGVIIGGFGG